MHARDGRGKGEVEGQGWRNRVRVLGADRQARPSLLLVRPTCTAGVRSLRLHTSSSTTCTGLATYVRTVHNTRTHAHTSTQARLCPRVHLACCPPPPPSPFFPRRLRLRLLQHLKLRRHDVSEVFWSISRLRSMKTSSRHVTVSQCMQRVSLTSLPCTAQHSTRGVGGGGLGEERRAACMPSGLGQVQVQVQAPVMAGVARARGRSQQCSTGRHAGARPHLVSAAQPALRSLTQARRACSSQ